MPSATPLATEPPAAPAPGARFWDRIAERYARRPVADEGVYQEKLRRTRARLRPEMAVLEVGCGTGTTAIAHAPHVRRLLATDLSPRMIEIARTRAADARATDAEADAADAGLAGLDFRCAALDDLETGETWDAILALSLLHLVPDRDAALAQMYRMLKPGGLLVTSTACLADAAPWFRFVGPIGRAVGLFPLVRVFGYDALRESLTAAGFRLVDDWLPARGQALFLIAEKPA